MGHNPTEEEKAFSGFMHRLQTGERAPGFGPARGGGGDTACGCIGLIVLIGIGVAVYFFFFK